MIEWKNKEINKICLGDNFITQVYKGDTVVYEGIFTSTPDVGFIAVYDTQKGKRIYTRPNKLDKVNFDRFVPIGICVSDSLMCSLVLMSCDTPTIGETDHDRNNTTMHYGPSMTISGIPNCKTKEEALNDFDGYNYTKVLVDKRGSKDYSKWTPGNLTYFDYPASSCCDIFYTVGTNQTDWYLPAAGELNLLSVNFDIVNSSLQLLMNKGIRCCDMNGDRYWSSCDYGGLYAWNIVPSTQSIDYNNKQTNNYKVRAFYKLN